jgi:hypothetical protein
MHRLLTCNALCVQAKHVLEPAAASTINVQHPADSSPTHMHILGEQGGLSHQKSMCVCICVCVYVCVCVCVCVQLPPPP